MLYLQKKNLKRKIKMSDKENKEVWVYVGVCVNTGEVLKGRIK